MKLPIFENKVNYVEIFVINKASDHLDTNLSDEAFYKILENIKKKRYKCFKKTNVKTYNSKMEFVKEDGNENVFEMNIVDHTKFSKNKRDFICLKYRKIKKASYTFPSNEKIYDMISNVRYTFKLNNLAYLNFQVSEDYEGNITKEVFINVNQARSCDESILLDIINEAIAAF